MHTELISFREKSFSKYLFPNRKVLLLYKKFLQLFYLFFFDFFLWKYLQENKENCKLFNSNIIKFKWKLYERNCF